MKFFATPIANSVIRARRANEEKRRAFAYLDSIGYQSVLKWHMPNGMVENYCPKGSGYGTPTNVYVDPSIAANSGTGTIGDPYGDLQYALDTMTRDSTNGDQINIKAGTYEIVSSTISLATYGTPTATAPLIFRGYTSAANDGGIGQIQNNFSASAIHPLPTGTSYCHGIDLEIDFDASTGGLSVVTGSSVQYCELYNLNNTSNFISVSGTSAEVVGCHIHTTGNTKIIYLQAVNSRAFGNYIEASSGFTGEAIYANQADCITLGNIIYMPGSPSGVGVGWYGSRQTHCHNTILAVTGTGTGILPFSSTRGQSAHISGNYVEGFSGTGGDGIDASGVSDNSFQMSYNAAYNNTTNITAGDSIYATDNEALSNSGLSKSGAITFANRYTYFAPADEGNMRNGMPNGWDKGAVQHADPAGGGAIVNQGLHAIELGITA